MSAPIFNEKSLTLDTLSSYHDCGGINLPRLGPYWINLGATFSLLEAVLGLLGSQFVIALACLDSIFDDLGLPRCLPSRICQ